MYKTASRAYKTIFEPPFLQHQTPRGVLLTVAAATLMDMLLNVCDDLIQ